LNTQGDKHFEHVGMPVDVFHARNHHKESDIFCNVYCNPARFPELVAPDGKWLLNSSVAEQTNVWFGAFQAMTRELPASRSVFSFGLMPKPLNVLSQI
jgi:hypothetical protein